MDYQTKMQEWLSSPLVDEKDKEQIRNAEEETKKEMFSSDLHFGTAGMRALLGPGSARLNLLTVRRATIGVALFLLEKYGQEACKTRGFAISFDNRHYSKEFRDTAAKVLTELGFNVYTFRDPHPTPELSYTVRFFHCVGGLMLTASHNPKEYNGYKFYDEEGCQGVYEVIDGLIAKIDSLPDELHVSYTPIAKEKQGSVTYLDDSEKYDEDFTDKEVSTSLYKDVYEGERLTKIVFTPECGCDCKVGPMVLRKAGYTVSTVPSQDFFDPDFKGTPNPNPETEDAYLAAFDHLKELNGKGGKYNLILATDPDADRMGIAFLNKEGKIQRFTGNQTGALLIDFVLGTLQRRDELPTNGCICNTYVTGAQGAKVASLYNIKVRTTATGFKYIGNMADRMREEGDKYLFGYEESYGYLLQDFIRDKDSLQGIVAVADMVEYYLRQGKTLDIALADLDKRTGHYYDTQVNIYFHDAGLEKMNEEIEAVRNHPFSTLAGKKVKTCTDYEKRVVIDFEKGTRTPLVAPDIDTTNCLRFDFTDESFLCIRPSGTEPKVKFYIEIVAPDEEAKPVAEKMAEELKVIMHLA